MRKTSSIAAVAMSIFSAVMIISVISAYQSTYGFSLQAVEDETGIAISNSTIGLNATLLGNNYGLTDVNLFLLNKSFIVSPGEKILSGILLPLNLDKLNQLGYPTQNVSMSISVLGILGALFFNLTKSFSLGKSVLPAPFDNFSVNQFSFKRNGSTLIAVTFNYFLPIVEHFGKILVKFNGSSVGNLSLSNITNGFNQLSSYIKVPRNTNSSNLTFSAGPFTWKV